MAFGLTTNARKALTDWVTARAGLAGITPIWADQDAPAPKSTYVTLRPEANTSVGEDYVGAPDGEGIVTVVGNRELMIYMQAIGVGALDALQSLRDSLQLDSVQELFIAAGLAVIDAQTVENLTGLIGQNMNERGTLDVRFRTNSSQTDDAGLIEKVKIDATVVGSVSEEEEFEINVGF